MIHMFHDRTDAGKRLAEALKRYEGTGALILGIPRGGVEVACQVAKVLALEFSILIVRKLPFPDSPESSFGAIAEDGSLYLVPDTAWILAQNLVDRIVEQQQAEVVRRVRVLHGGRTLPDLRNRHVIVVDDGIAMGSTMQAAVLCCQNLGASYVTVASPVASPKAKIEVD
jgi:predicted phosphoribosyltransferase